MQYTEDELMDLPMKLLQGVDIRSKEEEEMVQRVIDRKRLASPQPLIPLRITSSDTDGMTKEKELALQAKIDAHNEDIRLRLTGASEAAPIEEPVPEPEPLVETPAEPAPTGKISDIKCTLCGSRGYIHKRGCSSLTAAVL